MFRCKAISVYFFVSRIRTKNTNVADLFRKQQRRNLFYTDTKYNEKFKYLFVTEEIKFAKRRGDYWFCTVRFSY